MGSSAEGAVAYGLLYVNGYPANEGGVFDLGKKLETKFYALRY